MNTKSIIAIGYFILGAALLGTVFFATTGVNSVIAMVLILSWMLVPYIVLAYILRSGSESVRKAVLNCGTVFLISAGGMYMLVDVMFIHPDPQGAIAVLMVPLLQLIGTGILSVFSSWWS